ncbi:MAG TPA: D-alanyl-D-alanine carboxypeptidase [Desulfosporosinus sp.]|nr:D-alanyl-D-alanine carboxypeptidase [Desulfosporosinus sp.]
MKFITAVLLAIVMMTSMAPSAFAEETSSKEPQIRGEGAYLIDVLSGQTLYMKNSDKPLAPASTTKIMTGLLAIEQGNLNDTVTASPSMLDKKLVDGTQIYLVPGEKMPLKDLLYALLLNSANDSAVDIAEHVGGNLPNFVEMMNQRAREIGANQTHFVNSSGLTEPGHVTTAHDLALIARVAYQNPTFAEYVRTKSQIVSRSTPNTPVLMRNENKLLFRDTTVDGIKTGYTVAAQNCLVASVTKDGRQFIGVILKSPGHEIWTDMQSMFEFGFTQFTGTIFKPSGSIISTIMVNNEAVNLIIDRPIYITQKNNDQNSPLNLRVKPTSSSPLSSVTEGQVVANVEVSDGDILLNTLPLKSSRTILPTTYTSSLPSNYISWVKGFMALGVVLLLLVSRKIYAKRRWRRRMQLARRRGA